MAPNSTANANVSKLTMWLLGALFAVATGAVSAYVGLSNSENGQAHDRIERSVRDLGLRLDSIDSLKPRVSALEARVDQALKSIDRRLDSIERKLDAIAIVNDRRAERRR